MRNRVVTGMVAGFVLALLGAGPALAMTIYVDPPTGSRITLDAEPSDSIENIRAKVQDAIGVEPQRQVLSFGSNTLEDGRTLSDYNIQRDSVLQLRLSTSVGGGMQLLVQTPFGTVLTVDVESSDSIESLRVNIETRIGVPASLLTLSYAGQVLADGRDLADYNIQQGSTIVVTLPAPQWRDSTLANPQAGVLYEDSVGVSGPSAVFTVIEGALPTGLTLDAQTGAIAGTPTEAGAARFTIRASSSSGSVDMAFALEVLPSVAATPGSTDSAAIPQPSPSPGLAETGTEAGLLLALSMTLAGAGGVARAASSRRRRRPESQ